jgi:hypothetical protein
LRQRRSLPQVSAHDSQPIRDGSDVRGSGTVEAGATQKPLSPQVSEPEQSDEEKQRLSAAQIPELQKSPLGQSLSTPQRRPT